MIFKVDCSERSRQEIEVIEVDWSESADWSEAEFERALDEIEFLRKKQWSYNMISEHLGITTDRVHKLGEQMAERRRRKARIFEHFSERRSCL